MKGLQKLCTDNQKPMDIKIVSLEGLRLMSRRHSERLANRYSDGKGIKNLQSRINRTNAFGINRIYFKGK